MKVVLDTNVIVSGTFYGGVPQKLLKAAARHQFELVVTAEIVAEYQEILLRFLGSEADEDIAIILDGLLQGALVVAPMTIARQICADPDDDKFLACALAAEVDVVVTGDKALLAVQGRFPFLVLNPRDALDRIQKATEQAR